MKIHITNLYNFNPKDELVAQQHDIAKAGRDLGFTEMGIFSFPVESDTNSELSKRLDGIISALEAEDIVFLQLPTHNGFKYENLLFHKIKAYNNTKIILFLHDTEVLSDTADSEIRQQYITLYKCADAIIAPSTTDSALLSRHGLSNLLFCNNRQTAAEVTSANNNPSLKHNSALKNIDGFLSLCRTDFYTKKILMDAIELVFSYYSQQFHSALSADESEIQIGFGLHDKFGSYSVWVGTAMQSIIEHTNSKICFHILHDKTLTTDNQSKLLQVATRSGHRIQFHFLDDTLFEDLIEQTGHFTIGTMFRIMLPELLTEVSKIIYLDADILVTRDIQELWDTNLNDYALAAVPDFGSVHGHALPLPVKCQEIPSCRYFNAGVLFINLNYFRLHRNMKTEVLQYLKENKDALFPDQDALNSLYNKETLLLDSSWNYFARQVQESNEKTLHKRIYHYASTLIKLYSLTEMDYQYFETIGRTPWGHEECRKQMNNALWRVTDRTNTLTKILFQVSTSNKKRIFYGSETIAMQNLYQLLTIHDEDYRILEEPAQEANCILPCNPFSVLAEEKKGSFLVFVLPEADSGMALPKLEQLGLIPGIDFFEIPRILPPEQGGYI